jgi:hypothetical protein
MVNKITKLPVIYIYCFDAKGQARIHLDEKNSEGEVTGICRGTGNATISDAKLVIRDDGVACPMGRRYTRHTIDCSRGQRGAVSCMVSQEGSDVKPYSARFRYIGKDSE